MKEVLVCRANDLNTDICSINAVEVLDKIHKEITIDLSSTQKL
jgi:hypothetical protein